MTIEEEKIIIEKKKLRIEWWKLLAAIITPIIAAAVAAQVASSSINKQLDSQAKLKNEEFQSQLFVMAIQRDDSNAMLKKLIHTGALDDSNGKYSFLVEDTIKIMVPKLIKYGDTSRNIRMKDVSRWDTGHIKVLCGGVEANNLNAIVYSNGIVKFSFDVKPNNPLKSLVASIIVSDSSQAKIETIVMPEISIPPMKISSSKRIIYEAYSEKIRKKYNEIGWIFTDWHCN